MNVVFDAQKDEINWRKHGLRLSDFVGFDEGKSVTLPDARADYGEQRQRTFGRIGGLGYMIVFTIREGQVRLISFRRAHEREMRRYERP